jgi:hypothetical protein
VDSRQEVGRSGLGLAGLSLLLTELVLDEGRVVRVESEHDLLVAKRVLLLDTGTLGQGSTLGGVENALDFGTVDQTAKVGLRDQVGRQEEVLLQFGGLGGGTVDVVESLEGGRGPDDKSAKVTTRGELEEVQGVDVAGLATGQVAETLDQLSAINSRVVDDQRTTALTVSATSQLTLTGTQLDRLLGLLNVGTSAGSSQDGESSAGLDSSGTLKDGRVDDQGNLGDAGDLVTTGEQQGGNGGSGERRSSRVSP